MRFFEIASGPLTIVVSRRFLKNSAYFFRGYPKVKETFVEFLDFKRNNPNRAFSKKDAPFSGGALNGYFHVHLFHGKVILVYGISQGQIRLYDMVEHNGVEGSSVETLARYIAAADRDLVPYAIPRETQTVELSSEEKKDIIDLFYEMAVQDRDILENATHGNLSDLMEFCILAVEKPEAAILDAFGGKTGLIQQATMILRQTGH